MSEWIRSLPAEDVWINLSSEYQLEGMSRMTYDAEIQKVAGRRWSMLVKKGWLACSELEPTRLAYDNITNKIIIIDEHLKIEAHLV